MTADTWAITHLAGTLPDPAPTPAAADRLRTTISAALSDTGTQPWLLRRLLRARQNARPVCDGCGRKGDTSARWERCGLSVRCGGCEEKGGGG